jgi:hypothetical protein
VSPVHVFPRFRFSNGTARQNFADFLKMTREAPQNAVKVRESQMAGAHATMWIACRMPDWLYFGNFDLVLKQIEMAGARSKCFGNFDARIEMDQNK